METTILLAIFVGLVVIMAAWREYTDRRYVIPAQLRPILRKYWKGVKATKGTAAQSLIEHSDIAASILRIQPNDPSWHSDPITEPQERRLKELGIKITDKSLKYKGIASKLIGMFSECEPGTITEYLEFFGIDTSEISETLAKLKHSELSGNPDSQMMWDDRPADRAQLLYLDFYGLTKSNKLKYLEAEQIITEHSDNQLTEEQLDTWPDIETMWSELEDPDYRNSLGIKQPKQREYIEAVNYYLKSPHHRPGQFDEEKVAYFLTLKNHALKQ